MLLQLEVKDTQGEFFLNLLTQLKSSVKNIKVLESKNEEISLDQMSDEEKWETFGNWEPNSKNMDMCSVNMLRKLDEEHGSEDYQAWQKKVRLIEVLRSSMMI